MSNAVQTGSTAAAGADPVIIKVGKRKRKEIRRLAKGRGRLFSQVLETHATMSRESGEVHGPVFVIVKEKKRKSRRRMGMPW